MGWQWSESKRDERIENMTEVQSQVSTLSIQHYQRRGDLANLPYEEERGAHFNIIWDCGETFFGPPT